MHSSTIFAGNTPLHVDAPAVEGGYVERAGSTWYRIDHFDQMRPFFMSIVSPADHWLFISSNGALSAGRKSPQHALFPYYTDDKIHDSPELTGSKTILLVTKGEKTYLWEPFSVLYKGAYQVERFLYKNKYGNAIIFEEVNHDLGLTFSYEWTTSNRYGFVKHSQINNHSEESVHVELLDGIQNLVPSGVTLAMQTQLSTLIDAYKKNELEEATGLGIYRLSSILVDKPEPSESLKATTVWSVGISSHAYLLSSTQLDAFRKGRGIRQEKDVRAERGAYFVYTSMELSGGQEENWYIVSELDQSTADVVAITQELASPDTLQEKLLADIEKGTENLVKIVAASDGLQLTQDQLSGSRHFSNVLFNIMRGGIFDHEYEITRDDLTLFFQQQNKPLTQTHSNFLKGLPESFSLSHLLEEAGKQEELLLTRMCYEYLPLTFSRRHGDPSRPWNFFSIDIQEKDGTKVFNYQGNWRDIFQNWEALCYSFPGFLESIIAKFVNASTPDGYNPYRITREGIDWEEIEPDDPWSYIGYWGDHQIIYLLKLMEASQAHHLGLLDKFMAHPIFVYANVPYRIKPYEALLANPHDTIEFDESLSNQLRSLAKDIGADGKLLWGNDGKVYRANLMEKLLVTALAKMSNFIPEAGIWMNTQRPEWNDANNALVGYGVSMVTACYLRRFMVFLSEFLPTSEHTGFEISEEVVALMEAITHTLESYEQLLGGEISNKDRKAILDGLGGAGSTYRNQVYSQGFSGVKISVKRSAVQGFLDISLRYLDHSIQANKRADNLYHAYNLITLDNPEEIQIRYLYEMLEGQVAVLSSGFLTPEESVEVLSALKNSAMFREDQYSYMLYPDRKLPRFTEKNKLPAELVAKSTLLQRLVAEGNKDLIEQDVIGGFHFNGDFRNAGSVREALTTLSRQGYADEVKQDSALILKSFEQMFDHQSFTGRSGTFFGYEGLGSIYWHMVSKLLLTIGETYYQAVNSGVASEVLAKLIDAYYETRAGIGLNKNPSVYGGFPTDPYSHTPGNAGVQQPGMTGQVKEDILSRWAELGVCVEGGTLHFMPVLLRRSEFLTEEQSFTYVHRTGKVTEMMVPADALAFTYCQVPVVYTRSPEERILLKYEDGSTQAIPGLRLPADLSESIFNRDHSIVSIEVYLEPRLK
ncbi:MAG: hypothetical protein AAGI38_03105 [Bacteroidota bacterium]